jgi:release factor glutamine methyltransferase
MTAAAALDPRPSVAATRRALAQSFRRHSLATPELDARLLVGHALGLDHTALAAQAARVLSAEESDAVAALAARRLTREPVARIIGSKEFWGLTLALNSATLVPRPETETVVEAALEAIDRSHHGRGTALRIADLGTGSGALLLALLSELPLGHGVGTDVSLEAARAAHRNASALGLSERASFVVCDYGAALAGAFDLLVSNPPYVARGDIATLAPEVRMFDPTRALDGGPDGLDGYRAVALMGRQLLKPGGILVLELGIGQLAAVEDILSAAGLAAIGEPRHDLLGIARALAAEIPP